MRFLFCSLDSPGFLYPAIGVAEALNARGHETAFVTNIHHAPFLANLGLQRIPRGDKDGESFQVALWGKSIPIAIQVKHIEYAIERFQPDALVGQPLTFGALLAAERRKIPVALLGFCTYLWPCGEPTSERRFSSPTNIEDVEGWRSWRHDGMLETLNEVRALFRLPAHPRTWRETPLLGDLFLVQSVPELELEPESLPDRVHLVGSCLWEPDTPDSELEAWLLEASDSGVPLLYVQHGRFFHHQSFWPRLIEALSALDCRVVASLDRLDSEIGTFPENFLVRPHVPQGRVLRQAHAVVAGANTTAVLGALTAGVPSLLIPGGGEQPDVAALGKRAGVARLLLPQEATPENLREAVQALLTQPGYRRQARHYASAFARRDGLRAAADLLEQLAETGGPVLREVPAESLRRSA